jgi:hypothetical protein
MAQFCECAMEGGPPPHPARLRPIRTKEGSCCPVKVLNMGAFGPALRIRRFEGPNLRIRNGRRSAAASCSTLVPEHRVGLRGHGVHCHQTKLEGPGGECRLLEVTFCEYIMQDAQPPHPTPLVFTNTKQAYTVTIDKATSLYWRAQERTRRFEGPFGEYAMRGSPQPHPARLTSSRTKQTSLPTVSLLKLGIFEAPT